MDSLRQCVWSNRKMDTVALAKGEADGKSWIDHDRSGGANEEMPAAEIAGNGGGLLFSQSTRSLVGAECRRRGASERPVVVVVVLIGHVRSLQRRVHGRRWGLSELNRRLANLRCYYMSVR